MNTEELQRLARRDEASDFSVLNLEVPGQKALLKRPSRPLDPASPGISSLIAHLENTARHLGGAGIAAIQIGIPVRLFLLRRTDKEGQYEPFINPRILRHSGRHLASWEHCLSIPWGYRYTERASTIKISRQNLLGENIVEILQEDEAVVFQQEMDHLDGILLSDGYSKSRFIPADEINAFAGRVWRRCHKLSTKQCDALMKTEWKKTKWIHH